jgi:hypothetical protein
VITDETIAKVVSWLRAGYPDGVPEHDYIPLIALLGSQLAGDEVTLIAGELAFSSNQESAPEIKKAISAITRTTVSDSDIARVRSHLAAGGWPRPTGTDRKAPRTGTSPRRPAVRRPMRVSS